MPIVKMDRKGRIQLPSMIRKQWNLRPRQSLVVSLRSDEIALRRVARPTSADDPVLRDILEKPLRTKQRITRAMLEKLQDEMWSP